MHHLPSTPLQLGRGGTTDDDDFAGEFGEGGFVDWDGGHLCFCVCDRAVARFKLLWGWRSPRGPGISANSRVHEGNAILEISPVNADFDYLLFQIKDAWDLVTP